jgi:HK97 family phage portal protein
MAKQRIRASSAPRRRPAKTAAIGAKSLGDLLSADGQLLAGFGSNGARPRPFNVQAAQKQFRHWAYAAAMYNANAVANVPLRLFARMRPGRQKLYATRPLDALTKRFLAGRCEAKPSTAILAKVATFAGDLQEVIEPHPALSLLRTVNPWDNGYALSVLRMIDLQVAGNSFVYVINGGVGIPEQIWRLPPQLTEIIPSKTKFIDGYRYGSAADARVFPERDVDHFKMPNPVDLLYGMGWYQAAWEALGLHESKRTMDLAKFDNMARPDYLLSVKSAGFGTKKEAIDNFVLDVEKRLRGPKNAGRFIALSGDVTATALNVPVEEIGTATRVIEEISAVSGVPVAMLLSNDPNRANSQVARVGWYRNTIRPYCRLDEEKLNERWLPRFAGAEDLVLSYDLASFEDEEMQAKRLIGLVAGGVLKPNEARAEMGYDRLDDPNAERLYPPSGLTGGGAAVGGDLSPGQNDQRNNP